MHRLEIKRLQYFSKGNGHCYTIKSPTPEQIREVFGKVNRCRDVSFNMSDGSWGYFNKHKNGVGAYWIRGYL